MGEEGGRQGRIGVNSDGFLRRRAKGASTLDLMVTEFQMGCGQTDLASACVLRPLNRLVLYFKMRGGRGVKWQNTTWSLSGETELTEGTWLQLML